MRFELIMDDDIYLAVWDSPDRGAAWDFPADLWAQGFMLLNGQPIRVMDKVTFLIDGRCVWDRKVCRV